MKNVKRFINTVSALILVTLMLFAFSPHTAGAASGWWDPSWQYRMPIDMVENSGVNLTNYQVPITLDGSFFDYSKAQANGNDMRFISDGAECDYWIETWNPSGESRIWVEVPSLPGGDTATMYMYYGNPGATGASNGEATFEFFDDFHDGTLDKWKYLTGASVVTDNTQPSQFGAYAMDLNASTGSGYAKCNTDLMQDAAIRVLMKDLGTGPSGSPDADGVVGLRGSDSNTYDGILVEHDTDMGFHFDIGAVGIVPGDYITFDVWEWQEFAAYGTIPSHHQAKHWVHGDIEPSTYSLSATSVSVITPGLPFLRVYSGQAHISAVVVRKYISPEPTVNFGEESEQVAADFSAQPTMGEAPLIVQFRDGSSGDINSWSWSFGDGAGSSSQHPSHTYQNEGIYTVTLTVSGDGGTGTRVKRNIIIVEAVAIAPRLSVRNLNATPTYAQPRQAVTISADVVNEGGTWGSQTVNLMVNGYLEQSVGVGVSPGTANPISFTVYRVEPREYQVTIGEAIATFYVMEEAEPSALQHGGLIAGDEPGTNGVIAIICIAIIILGGITAIFLMTTHRA